MTSIAKVVVVVDVDVDVDVVVDVVEVVVVEVVVVVGERVDVVGDGVGCGDGLVVVDNAESDPLHATVNVGMKATSTARRIQLARLTSSPSKATAVDGRQVARLPED